MGHAAGSEGWLGHYLTWFVLGVGEFFHENRAHIYGALSHFFSTPRLMPHTSSGWGFQWTGALLTIAYNSLLAQPHNTPLLPPKKFA